MNALVPLPFTSPVSVVAPVPPFATFNVPARVTAPDVAVEGVNPVVPALNDVTGAVPLDAEVNLPCASTVILAFVYEPAETAVLAKLIVEPLVVCDTDVPVPASACIPSNPDW